MQVVGRPCDVCDVVVKSELDGVACLRCERVFHDACVAQVRTETYRTPRPPKEGAKPKKVRAPVQTICPTCGNDVRALKRDRDRVDARAREQMQHASRAAVREATSSPLATPLHWRLAIRIGIAIIVGVITVLMRSRR